MSDYSKTVNFAAKDALISGDPNKVIQGTELNTEFTDIATAIATKADKASPTFTGTVNTAAISSAINDASASAVTDILTLTHTTSGTAAIGIGAGVAFAAETLGGTHTLGTIDFVTTDVTDTTEDADFVVNLMAAGAAPAERFRVSSAGVATATTFVGALTGNVTGNVSGTAATVTTAAQPAITSLGTLTTLTVDNITIDGAAITSDTGAISFGNENLTTAGTFACGALTSTGINDDATTESILVEDGQFGVRSASGNYDIYCITNNGVSICGGSSFATHGQIHLYNSSDATYPNDIRLSVGPTTRLHYDNSATTWDFQANAITTTGTAATGALTVTGSGSFTAGITSLTGITLGEAGVSNGDINSTESIRFNMDTDNAGAATTFRWYKSAASGAGTLLLELNQAGQLNLQSGAFTTTGSISGAAITGTGAAKFGTTAIIGSTSVTPKGVLHLFTSAVAGSAAQAGADELVLEGNGDTGATIISSDAGTASILFGSPATTAGASLQWSYTSGTYYLASGKVGASVILRSDNNVTNLTLSGASGSELGQFAGDVIVGSSSVAPDGTLHVHAATAGTVTANADADDLVVENSASGGLSILTPDASFGSIYFGSPTSNLGADIAWNYSTSAFYVATSKVGASMFLRADNQVTNLTLSGASGSELGAFAGTMTTVKGVTLAGTSGNVGIGIAHGSADGKLHVHSGSAGSVTAHANADDLIVENSVNGGISILGPDINSQNIYFGSASSNLHSYIQANYSLSSLDLGTIKVGASVTFVADNNITNLTLSGASGSEIAKFEGGISLSGATPTAGGGIAFPATQVASADANTLDDYEEGTWTPTDGSGAALSITPSECKYTKVGRLVFLEGTITYPATADGSTASITGAPFTAAASGFRLAVTYTDTTNVDYLSGGGPATTFFLLRAGVNTTNAEMSGKLMIFSGYYTV